MNELLGALEDAMRAIDTEIAKSGNRANWRKLDLLRTGVDKLWSDAYKLSHSKATYTEAKAIAKDLGMDLIRNEHGEYRVNFKRGTEGTAYYTNDLEDAVQTARAMRKAQEGL